MAPCPTSAVRAFPAGAMMHTSALLALLSLAGSPRAATLPRPSAPLAQLRFEVVVPRAVRAEPVTGRVFVFVSRDSAPEPRLQAGGMVSVPFWGADIDQVAADAPAILDGHAVGYPLLHLGQLAPGDYYVQAIISPYTRFARADGHTIWAHMDECEGQEFNTAPGTLVSDVRRIHVDPSATAPIRIEISR